MKIALITGASSGIGREFVYAIDREGGLDELWVVARRGERLEELRKVCEPTDAAIAKYAERNKRPLDEFKKMVSESDRKLFADGAAMQKTLDFVKANAE